MSTTFPLDGMRVRFAGATDVGRRRDHNEDSIFLPVDERLAIVADGMGGHASGEVASKLAVDTVVDYFRKTSERQSLTWPFKTDRGVRGEINRMTTAVMLANLEIHEHAQKNRACRGMGTTVDCIWFLDDTTIVGHVGDSRVYRLREGLLSQLTEDHSLVNDYVKMKRVTPEEAENSPHKNVIVRALGMKATVATDIVTGAPQVHDVYLLCSDGLSDMLPDSAIQNIMNEHRDLDTMVAHLINAANDAGGNDNISVVLARIEPA